MPQEYDLSKIPYAEWLEQALHELLTFPAKGICIHAITPQGTIYYNHHGLHSGDKVLIAAALQQDAMIDVLKANGHIASDPE